jgi:hypothetical protein
MKLPHSVEHRGMSDFNTVLSEELRTLPVGALPLDKAMRQGNMVSDQPPQFMINDRRDENGYLKVRIGVFFHSVIGGCSCADDPTPIDLINEYTELEININLADASASVAIIDDVF